MTHPPAITLRPWEESEAARLVTLFNTPNLTRNLRDSLPNPYGEEDALTFIRHSRQATDAWLELAVEYGGEVVGTIGAHFKGNCATVGYWLGASYWRQGIMTKALPLFIDMLPSHITQLNASAFEFNKASQALLLRTGFVQLPGQLWERSYDGQAYPVLLFERER